MNSEQKRQPGQEKLAIGSNEIRSEAKTELEKIKLQYIRSRSKEPRRFPKLLFEVPEY